MIIIPRGGAILQNTGRPLVSRYQRGCEDVRAVAMKPEGVKADPERRRTGGARDPMSYAALRSQTN
jgi:hypothetical protein